MSRDPCIQDNADSNSIRRSITTSSSPSRSTDTDQVRIKSMTCSPCLAQLSPTTASCPPSSPGSSLPPSLPCSSSPSSKRRLKLVRMLKSGTRHRCDSEPALNHCRRAFSTKLMRCQTQCSNEGNHINLPVPHLDTRVSLRDRGGTGAPSNNVCTQRSCRPRRPTKKPVRSTANTRATPENVSAINGSGTPSAMCRKRAGRCAWTNWQRERRPPSDAVPRHSAATAIAAGVNSNQGL